PRYRIERLASHDRLPHRLPHPANIRPRVHSRARHRSMPKCRPRDEEIFRPTIHLHRERVPQVMRREGAPNPRSLPPAPKPPVRLPAAEPPPLHPDEDRPARPLADVRAQELDGLLGHERPPLTAALHHPQPHLARIEVEISHVESE